MKYSVKPTSKFKKDRKRIKSEAIIYSYLKMLLKI